MRTAGVEHELLAVGDNPGITIVLVGGGHTVVHETVVGYHGPCAKTDRIHKPLLMRD